MAMSEVGSAVTLSAWIARAADALRDAGSPSPRAEGERLAALALGIDWSGLWGRMADAIDARSLALMDDALARRVGGEPLAYIEESVVFYGLEIACGPGVLVPRPETETLVDVGLELVDGVERPVVADIGTGTGAVAIAIAARRPDAEVWATDVSTMALAWAERNVSSHGVGVWLLHGDLFSALPRRLRGRVDLAIANPPYVPDGADAPADVRAEPAEAVFAGPRGDEVLMRLADEAPGWLSERGAVALEVGTPEQAEALATALPGAVDVRADHTGRPRVVFVRRRDG